MAGCTVPRLPSRLCRHHSWKLDCLMKGSQPRPKTRPRGIGNAKKQSSQDVLRAPAACHSAVGKGIHKSCVFESFWFGPVLVALPGRPKSGKFFPKSHRCRGLPLCRDQPGDGNIRPEHPLRPQNSGTYKGKQMEANQKKGGPKPGLLVLLSEPTRTEAGYFSPPSDRT